MDAETHQQLDDPVSTATAATTAANAPTMAAASQAMAASENVQQEKAGPHPAPKRQRRPSVRLGDIGDQPAAGLSYDSHIRRTKQPQHHHHHPPWLSHHDPSSSKPATLKARSITNLVNGNRTDHHGPEGRNDGQNDNGGNDLDFGYRKAKAKRGTGKRVRSNWASSSYKIEEGDYNSREDEDEAFRNFDPDYESPVHTVENEPLDLWNGQRRPNSGPGRVRVSNTNILDYSQRDSDSRDANEGVMSWLIDLGLSRYAPVFEIHEVDDEVLPMLTLEDLTDMGISAVGSRRKLYSAIQKLRRGLS